MLTFFFHHDTDFPEVLEFTHNTSKQYGCGHAMGMVCGATGPRVRVPACRAGWRLHAEAGFQLLAAQGLPRLPLALFRVLPTSRSSLAMPAVAAAHAAPLAACCRPLPLLLPCLPPLTRLGMEILTGDFKQGLSQLLAQTHVQAIVLGTRRWVGVGRQRWRHSKAARALQWLQRMATRVLVFHSTAARVCVCLCAALCSHGLWCAAGSCANGCFRADRSAADRHTCPCSICFAPPACHRRGDPNAADQETFCPSSPGWPPFMRVNPILDWSYHDVWSFLQVNHGDSAVL